MHAKRLALLFLDWILFCCIFIHTDIRDFSFLRVFIVIAHSRCGCASRQSVVFRIVSAGGLDVWFGYFQLIFILFSFRIGRNCYLRAKCHSVWTYRWGTGSVRRTYSTTWYMCIYRFRSNVTIKLIFHLGSGDVQQHRTQSLQVFLVLTKLISALFFSSSVFFFIESTAGFFWFFLLLMLF